MIEVLGMGWWARDIGIRAALMHRACRMCRIAWLAAVCYRCPPRGGGGGALRRVGCLRDLRLVLADPSVDW